MSKKLLFLFQCSIIAEHTDISSTFTDNEPSYLTLECSIMYSLIIYFYFEKDQLLKSKCQCWMIIHNPASDLNQFELVVLTIRMVTRVTNSTTTSYTHTPKIEEIYTLIVRPPLRFRWTHRISIGLQIGYYWPTEGEKKKKLQ